MEKTIEIHAFHGWGFSAAFWSSWKEVLPGNVLLKPADRGYFGAEFIPEWREESKHKILFLHSYGLHWVPKAKITEADWIVLFNGFPTFHPNDWSNKLRSRKVLNGMVKEFKKEPDKVLKQFYRNCFSPDKGPSENLIWKNKGLLLSDLAALGKSKFKAPKIFHAKWIVFDSGKDRIVQGLRGEEFNSILSPEHYQVFEDHGHGLPIVKAQDCYKILSDTIPIFET